MKNAAMIRIDEVSTGYLVSFHETAAEAVPEVVCACETIDRVIEHIKTQLEAQESHSELVLLHGDVDAPETTPPG
jgi:hypothetical protein